MSTSPNIIFIMADDHASKAISAYGCGINNTPNIDRLANEGTMFSKAYCNVPVCGASRASVMTGLRPTKDRFVTFS
ncbi:MAG: iduronate sulfatase, partial [Rhodobacteraceae bacterium]|nr:iduronate sulfatase [Paracoccaceae bacterium]